MIIGRLLNILGLAVCILSIVSLCEQFYSILCKVSVSVVCKSENGGNLKIYYDFGDGFTEQDTLSQNISKNKWELHKFYFEKLSNLKIRIDPPDDDMNFCIQSVRINTLGNKNLIATNKDVISHHTFETIQRTPTFLQFSNNKNIRDPQISINFSNRNNFLKINIIKILFLKFSFIIFALYLFKNLNYKFQIGNIYSLLFISPIFFFWIFIIEKYASFWPFWDQWDVEASNLYNDINQGNFSILKLITAHNEHRILVTRLLNGFVYFVNDQWSPILNMVINLSLYVTLLAMLINILQRTCNTKYFLTACLLGFLGFLIPNHWENILGGIQSQYYFLAFFSLLSIYFSFFEKRIASFIFGWASFFSMAGGALTFVTLILAEIFKANSNYKQKLNIGYLILLFISFTAAIFITPRVPGHEVLKAKTYEHFLTAALYLFSWPFNPSILYSIILKFPLLLFVLLIAKKTDRNQHFLICILYFFFLWLNCQELAIAFSRGMFPTSSRYRDLLVMENFLSICLWMIFISLVKEKQQKIFYVLIVSFFVNCNYQYIKNVPSIINEIECKGNENKMQITILQTFIDSNRQIKWPIAEAPTYYSYPQTETLSKWLADSQINSLLPLDSLLTCDTNKALAPQFIDFGNFNYLLRLLLFNSVPFCFVSLFMLLYISLFYTKPNK